MSRPVALIPLNALNRAKGRLAALFGPDDRVKLAAATFAEVAHAASEAGLRVVVLAARPEDVTLEDVEIMAERSGVSGLSAQLEGAFKALAEAEVLVLHADLPLASAAELRRLIDAAPPAPSVTLVRSRDGGTNAMFLRPAGCIPLCYGPGSFEQHVAAARKAGVQLCVVESDTLALDLDTPDDVEAFLEHGDAPRSAAYRVVRRRLPERP